MDSLKEYGITKKNLCSITTDNGSDMLKMVALLNSDLTDISEEELEEIDILAADLEKNDKKTEEICTEAGNLLPITGVIIYI